MSETATRIVILGAGFGGLELSTRLSLELGDRAEVTLIDRSDAFVFGFHKLDVMVGHAHAGRRPPHVRRTWPSPTSSSARRRWSPSTPRAGTS